MLTRDEEAEQGRINDAHVFGLRLACMTQGDAERLALRDWRHLGEVRAALGDLAIRFGRETRCAQALQFARGGLAEGCDLAMQRIADAEGRDLPEWGAAADPWMALHPAVEAHALVLALSDLLTPEQRAATSIAAFTTA